MSMSGVRVTERRSNSFAARCTATLRPSVATRGINFGATKKWRDAQHNPRFPNFADECLRIRPTRIVSWGLEGGTSGRDFRPNARSVG
jgi:hypothetical protein